MNPIDAVLLAIIAINLVLGLIRGAVWQVLKLAALILGIGVAWHYGEPFRAMWPESLGLEGAGGLILAQAVLFLSVYLVIFGISHMLRALIKKIDLGSIDRLLGGLIGAAKGVVFGSILLYLQFVPFVTEIDSVKVWLYGSEIEDVEPSIGNRLFIEHIEWRISKNVPEDVTVKVNGIMRTSDSRLRPR